MAVLKKDPERFTSVSWDGDAETSFRVEIEVDGWDRHRLLEDMSRTFAEAGINILDAHCTVNHPMVKNRFVVEVGDTRTLDQAINRLRNIDAVFDAYRVTPARVPAAGPRRRPGMAQSTAAIELRPARSADGVGNSLMAAKSAASGVHPTHPPRLERTWHATSRLSAPDRRGHAARDPHPPHLRRSAAWSGPPRARRAGS